MLFSLLWAAIVFGVTLSASLQAWHAAPAFFTAVGAAVGAILLSLLAIVLTYGLLWGLAGSEG